MIALLTIAAIVQAAVTVNILLSLDELKMRMQAMRALYEHIKKGVG